MTGIDRFSARASDKGHGVWDHATTGWHGKVDLAEDEAKQRATSMNARVSAHQQPGRDSSRKVSPPKRVVVHIRELYKEATLDWWVRETDGWHGRVKYSISGKSEWVHADNIRQAT